VKFKGIAFPNLKRPLLRRNAAFKKMSKKKQRLEVVKDVIELLTAKKITAASTYISIPDEDYEEACLVPDDDYEGSYLDEAKPEVAKIEAALLFEQAMNTVGCEVCGIGSLFVAAMRRHDKFTIQQFTDMYKGSTDTRGAEVEYLSKWFDVEQLDLIERYYENSNSSHYGFGPIFNEDDDDTRLRMIMENILSNDGVFDPTTGKHGYDEGGAV